MGIFSWLKGDGNDNKDKPGFAVGMKESNLMNPPKDDTFKAYIPNFLYKPPFGYPLNKNVLQLKELAKNPYVFSVIRTLKDEAATTKWGIRLKREFTEDKFSGKYDSEIKRITQFFNNPNGNEESFSDILAEWVVDLCEVDAAVGVKVFNKKRDFSQLFARDGGSFLKNPDIFGYLGERDEFCDPYADINPNLIMPDRIKLYGTMYSMKAAYFQYGFTGNALPVPFGRRELMYIMGNPRADSIYGRSPIEILNDTLLTLVYGQQYNLDYYINGNAPDGLINLVGADQDIVDMFKERMKDKFKTTDNLGYNKRIGHRYPIYGGPAATFVPFSVSSKDLEIIEQQRWFTKLVWIAFGVSPDQMGMTEDSNRSVSNVQTTIYKRKTLRPLLKRIEYAINTQLMVELDPTGVLEFKFDDYDVDEDTKRYKLYELQIQMGVKTPEMVAREEGMNLEELKKDKLESAKAMKQITDIIQPEMPADPNSAPPSGKSAGTSGGDGMPRARHSAEPVGQVKADQTELEIGKQIEKEHLGTIDWVKDYFKKNGKFPPDTEVTERIAKEHLQEFDKYYTNLKLMEESMLKENQVKDQSSNEILDYLEKVKKMLNDGVDNEIR
jgi:phage portal protein BeeE